MGRIVPSATTEAAAWGQKKKRDKVLMNKQACLISAYLGVLSTKTEALHHPD